MVKHYSDRIEISNPGGFIGGVSASNILHHPPVSRNPLLVDALLRLRLVNRSNLGIGRMYQDLLIEGKEPPIIEDLEGSVRVTFLHQGFSSSFRSFFEEEHRRGTVFKVDELIILRYLLMHSEMDTAGAALRCQRSESVVFDLLCAMEQNGYVERGGSGRGTYWVLSPVMHKKLAGPGNPERDRRINWDAAKTRILSVLKDRQRRREKGLSNKEIRQITHYDRDRARRLINQLINENESIRKTGKGRWTLYELCNQDLIESRIGKPLWQRPKKDRS